MEIHQLFMGIEGNRRSSELDSSDPERSPACLTPGPASASAGSRASGFSESTTFQEKNKVREVHAKGKGHQKDPGAQKQLDAWFH